jgi:hypothetical protein
MRTAIVSDLHLGSGTGEDLVSDPAIRAVLLERIASADRLVLLGDVLELRELPLARVLAAVRPFFEDLGEAMAGRRVVLVPGNHDHHLAEPLLERLALDGDPLGLEHRALPAGGPLERISSWLGTAELSVAYPGVWLRDDVYATHGHYMDCHMNLPRIECIGAAALMRIGSPPGNPSSPGDYERILRPIYGLSLGLAEASLTSGALQSYLRTWHAMTGRRQDGGRVRQAALEATLGVGVPAGVWFLNKLLRAEFGPDISPSAIGRSGVEAALRMANRLQIDAAHVITGHTHRAGPEEGDAQWPLAGGGTLHNTGSWVYADVFHHPGRPPGPYWPGTVTWLEDEGPPRRERLLIERPRGELRGAVQRTAERLRATRR